MDIPYCRPAGGLKIDPCDYIQCTGVDLGGIQLSRAPQIFRRNTRYAGTVICPDYQFLPRFWGPGFRASIIILTNMFKQMKQIRITLMTMFKVDPSPANEIR